MSFLTQLNVQSYPIVKGLIEKHIGKGYMQSPSVHKLIGHQVVSEIIEPAAEETWRQFRAVGQRRPLDRGRNRNSTHTGQVHPQRRTQVYSYTSEQPHTSGNHSAVSRTPSGKMPLKSYANLMPVFRDRHLLVRRRWLSI